MLDCLRVFWEVAIKKGTYIFLRTTHLSSTFFSRSDLKNCPHQFWEHDLRTEITTWSSVFYPVLALCCQIYIKSQCWVHQVLLGFIFTFLQEVVGKSDVVYPYANTNPRISARGSVKVFSWETQLFFQVVIFYYMQTNLTVESYHPSLCPLLCHTINNSNWKHNQAFWHISYSWGHWVIRVVLAVSASSHFLISHYSLTIHFSAEVKSDELLISLEK